MRRSKSGSALVTTIILSALMAALAAAAIVLSLNSYRTSKRNEGRNKAKAIAEGELEAIFTNFRSQLIKNTSVEDMGTAVPALWDSGMPTTVRNAFAYSNQHAPEGAWQVRRGVTYTAGDHIYGSIPGTNKTGHLYYVTARVEVIPPASYTNFGVPEVHEGRRMVCAVTSILQNGLFYQGDLEMLTGTDFDIRGDITVNGSVYLAVANSIQTFDADGNEQTSASNYHLNLFAKLRATGFFNQDAAGNSTLLKPDVHQTLVSPTTRLDPPTFVTSQATQYEHMDAPEDFLGGIEAAAALDQRPDLFTSVDDVYRAVVAPPPTLVDGTHNVHEYPTADYTRGIAGDNENISSVRVYNVATVIVTVNGANITVQRKDEAGDWVPDTTLAAAITGGHTLYDEREQRQISVSDINVGALSTLEGANWFNGVVYVNQTSATSDTPAAIRLLNGGSTPRNGSKGFTVATNGGVYIQGNYNDTTSDNPSVILGDAVTVLSNNWTDSADTRPLTSRVAAASDITINSAILTGSTAATPDTPAGPGASSGGAQNLVRYLEKFNYFDADGNPQSRKVNITGSIGRLFESRYFIRPFGTAGVYGPPQRNIQFDPALAEQNPKGAPSKRRPYRGTFFTY
ncbi:MAG TPA: hypothetical protein VFT72_03170 [Opitutaceae bacterium]|nr:hypothetical protein [Opitutaceae bacterium]